MALNEKSIINLDYNVATLTEAKNEIVAGIDREDIGSIEAAKKVLVKIRRAIQAKGKTYRDESNAFNKMVLEREHELVGIIEPIEGEMKELIEKRKQEEIMEVRRGLLPDRKKKLVGLDIVQPSDDDLMTMDGEVWNAFFALKFEEHQNNQEMRERKKREEKEREQREKEIEEKAIQETKARMIQEAEEEKARMALLAKQEEEKKEADQKRAEEKEAEELLALEADKKFNDWLEANDYNPKTDIINREGDEVELYRLVSSF